MQMVPAWVAFVQIYRSHGYFISDRTLSRLVAIHHKFLESGDEAALLERILGVAPVIVNATRDFESVSIASAVFEACVERWKEPVSCDEEDDDCDDEK
jgi:tetraacyldisaccharide-1-P 4'-kinase